MQRIAHADSIGTAAGVQCLYVAIFLATKGTPMYIGKNLCCSANIFGRAGDRRGTCTVRCGTVVHAAAARGHEQRQSNTTLVFKRAIQRADHGLRQLRRSGN
jgi:hypothetical protein